MEARWRSNAVEFLDSGRRFKEKLLFSSKECWKVYDLDIYATKIMELQLQQPYEIRTRDFDENWHLKHEILYDIRTKEAVEEERKLEEKITAEYEAKKAKEKKELDARMAKLRAETKEIYIPEVPEEPLFSPTPLGATTSGKV